MFNSSIVKYVQKQNDALAAVLTPAEDDVVVNAGFLREDSHEDERVQVQSLHRYPHVVGTQRVVEQRYHQLTLPVLKLGAMLAYLFKSW